MQYQTAQNEALEGGQVKVEDQIKNCGNFQFNDGLISKFTETLGSRYYPFKREML